MTFLEHARRIRVVTLALTSALTLSLAASTPSEIAVTFDDLPVVTAQRDSIERQEAITRELIETLSSRKIPVIGFVNADKLEVDGRIVPRRLDLLRRWLEAGFDLGNHGYAHRDLNAMSAAEFDQELTRGEAPLRQVMTGRPQKLLYFRHPFLHTGTSAELRDATSSSLKKRGYRVAPVTIDNSEWIFAGAYVKIHEKDSETRAKLVAEYLRYMSAKVAYHDAEAEKLFGRPIRQILLLHANALNADAFGQLADLLAKRGHRFITLDRALEDPAYRSPDTFFGQAGISWLDRWALTRGVERGFFADEPLAAGWVLALAGIDSE